MKRHFADWRSEACRSNMTGKIGWELWELTLKNIQINSLLYIQVGGYHKVGICYQCFYW